MAKICIILVAVCLTCTLLSSCVQDVEPLPVVTFLTVDVAADFGFSSDNWVFATNSNGEVLDAHSFAGPGTFTLEGPIAEGQKFTLHELGINNGPTGAKNFNVYSTTQVEFGTTWHINGTEPYVPPVTTPTASVAIHDFTGSLARWQISSVKGEVPFSGALTGSTLNATFAVKETSTFVVSSLYGNTAHYQILNDVAANTARSVTLKPMDKLVSFNIPNNAIPFLQFTGFYAGDDTRSTGYINSKINGDPGVSTVSMGYANGFEKYHTLIFYQDKTNLNMEGYDKIGAPITAAPTFDDPTLIIGSDKITNLSAAISTPFHSATPVFNGSNGNNSVYWTVLMAGDGSNGSLNFRVRALPEEITSMYPDFTTEGVNLNSLSYRLYKDDFRYKDILAANDPDYTGQRSSNEFFTYVLVGL